MLLDSELPALSSHLKVRPPSVLYPPCIRCVWGDLPASLPPQAEGMDVSLFATHWFNTLFAYSLPFELVVRIWDVFMVEVNGPIFGGGKAYYVPCTMAGDALLQHLPPTQSPPPSSLTPSCF